VVVMVLIWQGYDCRPPQAPTCQSNKGVLLLLLQLLLLIQTGTWKALGKG
jgi:hypothetical protein